MEELIGAERADFHPDDRMPHKKVTAKQFKRGSGNRKAQAKQQRKWLFAQVFRLDNRELLTNRQYNILTARLGRVGLEQFIADIVADKNRKREALQRAVEAAKEGK